MIRARMSPRGPCVRHAPRSGASWRIAEARRGERASQRTDSW
ncbi:hypothetical protein AKJ08_2057 [Vulgatibacter incomptus]|uniref:Uncharacterized protein n=1 Tax=Vulgatibacter incomptus TaxID=1391653 RepID=A0A0K1PDS4_9BACT|nr:hypothetical protein AKJ08_2057 [Vulgatibacter incomptus]